MAKKILLADDSVTIQKVVELTFMDEDYLVVAVSNGDDALGRLDDLAPDLVIADVHMPGADGYQVCREAKERRPGLPVLLLVGTFEPFQEAEAQQCGADGYLKKPFDSQELLRRVEELLAGAADGDEAAEEEPSAEDLPQEAQTGAEEMAPWGVLQEDAGHEPVVEAEIEGDLEVQGEEIWQGDPLEGEVPEADVVPVSVGPAEELELESSPWTEAQEGSEPASSEGGQPGTEGGVGPGDPHTPWTADPVRGTGIPPVEEVPTGPATAEGPAAPHGAPAGDAATPGAGVQLSDHDVERIARRLAEILGERTVREVAWEVVPDLAELVIKDRIRELERQLD